MYARPSHEVVNESTKHFQDQSDLSDDNGPPKEGPLMPSIQASSNSAILTLHRNLFLENVDLIRGLVRDCVKICSRIDDEVARQIFAESASRPHSASYLEILLDGNQPPRAFLRTTFRQVIGFITSLNHSVSFPKDINYLLSFINELRVAFSTSSYEDKKTIKLLSQDSSATGSRNLTNEACIYLYWACIQVARYCVKESNILKDIHVDGFLSILSNELSNSGKIGEKFSRQIFVVLIQSLEKALDSDLETSLKRRSFVSSPSSQAYVPHNLKLHRWIVGNRIKMAEFSLKINNPAQCWRNIDIKLNDNLTLTQESFTSIGSRISSERALDSSNTRNWRKNLSLITEAAIQLNDLDLLYGIQSLASGLICDFPPLSPMISNLEGNFEQTYSDLKTKSSNLDEQSLNEFLKACVEMNLLKENSRSVDLLQSDWLRNSYKKLIQCTDETVKSLETRLQEVKLWLGTWSDLANPLNVDLMMSAYIGAVSKAPREELLASHDEAEWLMNQEFISQTLFSPSRVNDNFKIYNALFEMLRLEHQDRRIPTDLVEVNSKNLRWNSSLFRHIRDLNWLDALRQQDDRIDLVQYRAIKYHCRCKNTQTAIKLSEDLMRSATSSKAKILSSLLMTDAAEFDTDEFKCILNRIDISTMTDLDKSDYKSKVFRRFLRRSTHEVASSFIQDASYGDGLLELQTSDELSALDWRAILSSSSDRSKLQSLSLISKICHAKIESSSSQTEKSISSVFKLDLELLKQLNLYKTAKYQSSSLNCAVRLLECIRENHSKLDQESAERFACQKFQEQTVRTWIIIKNNIIALLLDNKGNLPVPWRSALRDLLRVMVLRHPDVLLYRILANHLEYKLLFGSSSGSRAHLDRQNEGSDLWEELYAYMTSKAYNETDDWRDVIQQTEAFIREMRRISHLCGENLYALSTEVTKKLTRFLDRMRNQMTSSGGRFSSENAKSECEARFKGVCEHAIRQIEILLLFSEGPNPDTYGSWFKLNLGKNLRLLKSLVQHLVTNSHKSLTSLERLVSQVIDVFVECQRMISNYSNHLWMNLISPKLSRFQPSKIPMPGCHSDPCDISGRTITIHKISQTVEMIMSKTRPKRLVLIGSDGVSRSFLLKAHEDLRQDQFMMDLFVVINKLLSGRKDTQNICRLRNYSVTPISSKSGLIEWVDAPALTSIYKDWLAKPSGKMVVEDLYSSTCRMVCGKAEMKAPKSKHSNCRMPHDLHSADIFYQLIWAKARQTNHRSELAQQAPSRHNILKYRAEFHASLFESVFEQLVHRVPSDLISSSLWRRSINAYSYWRKTKQFTHSCATISMVGYIIGLGDRHLGNILLDYDTGEVIHIDFSLCFELGKKLSHPERVPFRLTQNLTRAFGFAGLEGCFTRTSRKVLNLMKDHRSTLLHLLKPTNWSFMLVSQDSCETLASEFGGNFEVAPIESAPHLDCMASSSLSAQLGHHVKKNEQILVPEDPATAAGLKVQTLESIGSNDSNGISGWHQLGSIGYDNRKRPFLNDLQVNIQTPTKLVEGTALQIYKRISSKLSGEDEQLNPIIARRAAPPSARSTNRTIDDMQPPVRDDHSPSADHQSTNDQVDALIDEATSLENKAAMYEGWTSWV